MVERERVYWLVGLILLTVFAWLLSYPDSIGICPSYGVDGHAICVSRYVYYAEPFSLLLSSIALIFLATFLGSFATFNIVRKFSYFYVPAVAILIILTPSISSTLISFDREQVAWFFSIVYVVISIALIIYKSWRNR